MINKKIKVIHLASFTGNIGDYANHKGFYNNTRAAQPKQNLFSSPSYVH